MTKIIGCVNTDCEYCFEGDCMKTIISINKNGTCASQTPKSPA